MRKEDPNRQEAAETLALQALTWLVENDDLLPLFLGSTGASAADIAANAGQPDFLGSVLDFILADDAWVVAFCDTVSLPYDAPMKARAWLPDSQQMNWT